jgi:hypothetical protein
MDRKSKTTSRRCPSENGRATASPSTKAAILASTERPTTLSVKSDGIPTDLKAQSRWVCWRWFRRNDKDGKWKWTKPPVDPKKGRLADATDPATWGTFQQAHEAYIAHKDDNRDDRIDGIGFVLGDGYAGFDLDECRDPDTGELAPWAAKIVAKLASYAEASPTGTGVKIFLKGKLPPGGNRKGKVELYDRGRFFTVTGRKVATAPATVNRRQKALDKLHARLFPPSTDGQGTVLANGVPSPSTNGKPTSLSDDDIIRRAKAAKNGGKFERLWAGDGSGYNSPSEADQALCDLLAFWTPDVGQIDRLFRRSGLYREEKWKRDDYRIGTIAKALAKTEKDHWQGRGGPADGQQDRPAREGYRFSPLTAGQLARNVRKPEWLVEGLLMRGQPAIWGGPYKSLKTRLAVDLAVSLATRMPFLGKFKVYSPVRVALLSGESGEWAILETIRRVCAARQHPIERRPLDPTSIDNLLIDFRLPRLGLDEDLKALETGLLKQSIDVLIFDPLYLGLLSGTALQASNLYDVGPLLSAVTQACLAAGTTPIFLHHTVKGLSPGKPAELGDLAFAGVAEYARQWLLINRRERFNPETGIHRLWLSAGGSCGQSGVWAVEVDEGRLGDDFEGRKWGVTVKAAGEHRDAERQEKENARKAKKERQDAADEAAVLSALDGLDPNREGHGYNRVRTKARLSKERMERAVLRLVERGVVKEPKVSVEVGKGAKPKVKGLQRVAG